MVKVIFLDTEVIPSGGLDGKNS